MTSALRISFWSDSKSSLEVSINKVALAVYGEEEKSRGINMGGTTCWILGTNVSLTREAIRLDLPTPGNFVSQVVQWRSLIVAARLIAYKMYVRDLFLLNFLDTSYSPSSPHTTILIVFVEWADISYYLEFKMRSCNTVCIHSNHLLSSKIYFIYAIAIPNNPSIIADFFPALWALQSIL